MSVKLKEIPGLMINKWNSSVPCSSTLNHAIDRMGERSVGINREKLAIVLSKLCESGSFYTSRMAVDAIIANESQILEFKEGE